MTVQDGMSDRPSSSIRPSSGRLRWLIRIYGFAWILGFPLVLGYFLWRSVNDRRYRFHLSERFGIGKPFPNAIWIHGASLGEIRSAASLVTGLIGRGHRVLITCLTPAARQEALRLFGENMRQDRMTIRYLPLEFRFALRRFLEVNRPKLLLILEFDIWPVMIESALGFGVPTYLCNAQITARNIERHRRSRSGLGFAAARLDLLERLDGAFVKSATHAERFRSLGLAKVHVTGELRFDQPVPKAMTSAATRLSGEQGLGLPTRPVITLASVVKGEDQLYGEMMTRVRAACTAAGRPMPLFVHVPRQPEHFDRAAAILTSMDRRVALRSKVLGAALDVRPEFDFAGVDVLIGDSLGEMAFYIELADLVIVGGGFLPSGAHNVIEPLARKKPVLVGPQTWTIEFPAKEAVVEGVLIRVGSVTELTDAVLSLLGSPAALARIGERAAAFHATHTGSTVRTLDAIGAAEPAAAA